MFQDTRPAAPGPEAGTGTDPRADFRVDDPADVRRLLKQLLDTGAPVTLNAPRGCAITSQLWSLDAAHGQMSFSADAASPHLQRLAMGDEAVAVAYLDQVKLQFDLADLVLVHGAHASALRATLPQVLYRFQRRNSYRVRTLERRAPMALLRHPSMPEMQLSLRIVDLSAGGCALSLPDDVPALQPGSSLCGVRIQLDSETHFSTTLRLQHVSTLPGDGDGGGVRLGCEFIDLDGDARRALQRCIDHTQQRRRLLAPR
ncbi:MAG: flagellar brake protein [Rubrivivax sp.]